MVYGDNGEWNDVRCEVGFKGVCEKPAFGPETTPTPEGFNDKKTYYFISFVVIS